MADEVAAGYFDLLMDKAEGSGLPIGDYKAPLGRGLLRRNKPWIAEFSADSEKRTKDGRYVQYRMYWGEAPEGQQALTACLIGDKPAGRKVADNTWRLRQDKQIKTAMDRLLSYCRAISAACRMLRER